MDQSRGYTRRTALGVSAAALAALGLGAAPAATAAQRAATGSGGLAGGGLATDGEGEAQFAVFASRILFAGDDEPTILGRVQWVDKGRGMVMESTAVTAYGPIPDQENARELRGTMRVNGTDGYPFVLRAVDAGPPGSGQDTIDLTVGAAALATPGTSPDPATPAPATDLTLTIAATVTIGDLQLLDLATE